MAPNDKQEVLQVGGREIKTTSNSFEIPLMDCEEIEVRINGERVFAIVCPYTGRLKCYFGREAAPLTYKK